MELALRGVTPPVPVRAGRPRSSGSLAERCRRNRTAQDFVAAQHELVVDRAAVIGPVEADFAASVAGRREPADVVTVHQHEFVLRDELEQEQSVRVVGLLQPSPAPSVDSLEHGHTPDDPSPKQSSRMFGCGSTLPLTNTPFVVTPCSYWYEFVAKFTKAG